MKKKNRKRIFGLVVLLLAISIGFAALSTTLKINGSAIINRSVWDIYWDNVSNVSVGGSTIVNTPARIKTGDVTTVEYNITLDEPGDSYEFTVDAVNNGTLDAMVDGIVSTVNGAAISTLPSYVVYTVTYNDGVRIDEKHTLGKKVNNTPTRETYKVKIEFLRSITNDEYAAIPDGGLSYNFSFTVKYVQADDTAIPKPVFSIPSNRTSSTLVKGDQICLRDQCFGFIKYDGDNAVLLANYNLNVGSVPNGSETFLQDSAVKGAYSDGTGYGKVDFSKLVYWNDNTNNTLKPEYGSSYPADVYDSNYSNSDPTNDNYSVAYYVGRYKTLLEGMGATIYEARLLKESEAVNDLNCVLNTNDSCIVKASGTFPGTTFWLGSADSNVGAACILYTGAMYNDYTCKYGFSNGVRPVILVNKSYF